MNDSTFDSAFTALIGNEGGYSNNPADSGGETMWGITARVARSHGYTGAMKDLPQDTAKHIARDEYWTPAGCDHLPDGLAFQVFDAAYNSGIRKAVVWLQMAVGSTVDGVYGPETDQAVKSISESSAIARFNGYRLRFMASLNAWSTFGRGWANRIANNLLKISS